MYEKGCNTQIQCECNMQSLGKSTSGTTKKLVVDKGPAVRLAFAAFFTCLVPLLWGLYQFSRTYFPSWFRFDDEFSMLIHTVSHPVRIFANMIFMFIASRV